MSCPRLLSYLSWYVISSKLERSIVTNNTSAIDAHLLLKLMFKFAYLYTFTRDAFRILE